MAGPIAANATAPQGNWSLLHHTLLPCGDAAGVTWVLVASYSVETALGVLGNACFIAILLRHKEKALVTTIFLLSLVVSDLLVCVFCLPFTAAAVLLDGWVFGEAMCRATSFIQCAAVTVSILSLVLIALERHQLVVHPTDWRPGPAHARLAVVGIWAAAALVSLPFATNSALIRDFPGQLHLAAPEAGRALCVCAWPSETLRLAYAAALLLLQYLLPLLFIAACYLRISLRLWGRERMLGRRAAQLRRVNTLLASMVGAFAACWLPLHVFNSIDDWSYRVVPSCLHDLVFSLCHLAAMASACINPVIYGFLNSNFKKEVKGLALRCRRRRSPGRTGESVPLSTAQTDAFRGPLQPSCPQAPA
ncbi:neuropeptide Y receptor type 4-2-like [Varanus komodoensis]|nr:neuropeptide Y receptor type 4-2-like [Varanus komodoensis]